jgi:hypothetical protein
MSQAALKASIIEPPKLPHYQGRAADRKALVDMQRTMFALTQDSKVAPHIRAACARAWRDLQETKRIMDGKPLPGQLRPDLEQRGAIKGRGQKMPSMLPMPEVPTRQDLPTTTGQYLPKESLSR